jgi:hypothetical protein
MNLILLCFLIRHEDLYYILHEVEVIAGLLVPFLWYLVTRNKIWFFKYFCLLKDIENKQFLIKSQGTILFSMTTVPGGAFKAF